MINRAGKPSGGVQSKPGSRCRPGVIGAAFVLALVASAHAQLPDGEALVCCVASELSPPCTVASLEDCVGNVGAPVPGEICCALAPLADTCTTGSCDTGLPAPCTDGAYECVDGTLACVPPSAPEVCDGQDNDCDGETDEGFPIGEACDGPDGDACVEGVTVCDGAGGVACSDSTPDNVEVCNGIDDDCDGTVDDEPANVGEPCGGGVGACSPGITACQDGGGGLVCAGEVGPTAETCNGIDDNCDGQVDEGACGPTCNSEFGDCDGNPANGCESDLSTSLAHCGACNSACMPSPNSAPVCSAGQCTLVCDPGFSDCDGNPANGCETPGSC